MSRCSLGAISVNSGCTVRNVSPQRQVREVAEARRLMDLFIEAEVIAVDVAEDGGHLERVIQRRVEDPLLLVTAAVQPDERQP